MGSRIVGRKRVTINRSPSGGERDFDKGIATGSLFAKGKLSESAQKGAREMMKRSVAFKRGFLQGTGA